MYYEPSDKVKAEQCIECKEYYAMIQKINRDPNLTEEQKQLLRLLATRFIVFHYEKIADLYSVSNSTMQQYMEELRCVIVDTDAAIKNGYFKCLNDINSLFKGVVDEK